MRFCVSEQEVEQAARDTEGGKERRVLKIRFYQRVEAAGGCDGEKQRNYGKLQNLLKRPKRENRENGKILINFNRFSLEDNDIVDVWPHVCSPVFEEI